MDNESLGRCHEDSDLISETRDHHLQTTTPIRSQISVKVLTLNLWGIVGISRHRRERFDALAELLTTSESDIDFVFLQEVWSEDDFKRLMQLSRAMLPFGHYFHSGVIGSGVCLLSKWPIIDIFSFKYNLNGYAHKFHHGDWFGGKVVGMAKVQHHDLIANLYVTHLHAEYDRLNDSYLYHRVCQAFEFSQFVSHTFLGNCDYTVVAGDFNTQTQDLPYQVILYNSRLRDAFEEKENYFTDTNVCATCSHPDNTYTTKSDRKANPEGQRIDYILYGAGIEGVRVSCEKYMGPTWKTKSGISISDHEPVLAVLRVEKNSRRDRTLGPVGFVNHFSDDRLKCRISCLQESVRVLESALTALKFNQMFFLCIAVLLLILLLSSIPVDSYVPVEYVVLVHIGRIILSLFLGFCLFMSFFSNRMERSSILSTKQAIAILLLFLQERQDPEVSPYAEKLPI